MNASIFNNINWYRVVLDEAHNIKCSKTKVAQSAFALNAYCRWCLTGTPLQVTRLLFLFKFSSSSAARSDVSKFIDHRIL